MEEINVQEHFALQADSYIELMKKLVPQYIQGQHTMIESIPFEQHKAIRVLDLGCGNGILSEMVLKKFPNANIVGFDITKEMLEIYEQKLAKYTHTFSIIQGDFKTDDFGSGYDIILSGLTLQHLNPKQRQTMFQKIFQSLNDGGMYITRDIIVGDNESQTHDLYDQWIEYMNQSGEEGQVWYEKHQQKDYPQRIHELKGWMQKVGFSNVSLKQQDINFAIISAIKGHVT